MAAVTLERVEKVFADGTRAVRALDLAVRDGELMVLVGPSGCGKTTALRIVAGLEDATSGTVRIGERVVNEVDCGERDVAMVFQNYALYPHMTVRRNMAFPLRLMGVAKDEQARRIERIARMLGLLPYLDRRPAQLSGGQRQRVAMGRALVREPQVFLMDEPLSNLDAKLRVQTRGEIARLQKQLGVTTLYVTHDQVEAMTMGDRVAVMRRGELQQLAAPQELYDRPANLFVAAFVGSPPMSLIPGEVAGEAGARVVRMGRQVLPLRDDEPGEPGRAVVVGLRPERLGLRDHAVRFLTGRVALRESIGSDLLVTLELDGVPPPSPEIHALAHDIEDQAEEERLAEGGTARVVGRFPPNARIGLGDAVEVAVPAGALSLFDAATGTAIAAATARPPARRPANLEGTR